MRQSQIKNVPYLNNRRKELRNNLTPAEATLWDSLKNNGFKNRKFRRQHSIGNYIVDFYCPSEKLIIELDGQGHFDTEQMAYDEERDKWLASLGNTVLRFENKVVFTALDFLLAEVERNFSK